MKARTERIAGFSIFQSRCEAIVDDNKQKPPQSTDLIFAIFFLAVVAGGTAWAIYIIDARFAAAIVDCFVRLARGPGY